MTRQVRARSSIAPLIPFRPTYRVKAADAQRFGAIVVAVGTFALVAYCLIRLAWYALDDLNLL